MQILSKHKYSKWSYKIIVYLRLKNIIVYILVLSQIYAFLDVIYK